MNIIKGIDFLLNHFDSNNLFPRTIMTKKLGKQETVHSKYEVLDHFEASAFVDCRINAFPSYTDYKGIQRYPPDFIFIDLDANDFNNRNELESALSETLIKITETFIGTTSTVLWTGNGYHIYQPLESIVLEQYDVFAKFQDPSKQFLRFAKDYLSSGKADSSNNPSFKSGLLRIPDSINSKCLNQCTLQNCEPNYSNESRVKIIQEWNGYRPSIKYLLRDFLHHLINQKIKESNKKIRKTSRNERNYAIFTENNGRRKIEWIEQLLKTPIADYRKHTISLILSPYLLLIKNLSYTESYFIMKAWLSQCDLIRKLDFDPNHLVKLSLNAASNKRILPMSLTTLKNRNIELYHRMTILK